MHAYAMGYGSSELRTKGATSRHSDASVPLCAASGPNPRPRPMRAYAAHLPRSILRIVAVFLLSPSSDPTLPLPLLLSLCSLSLGAWSSSATVFLVAPPSRPGAPFSSFLSPGPYAYPSRSLAIGGLALHALTVATKDYVGIRHYWYWIVSVLY